MKKQPRKGRKVSSQENELEEARAHVRSLSSQLLEESAARRSAQRELEEASEQLRDLRSQVERRESAAAENEALVLALLVCLCQVYGTRELTELTAFGVRVLGADPQDAFTALYRLLPFAVDAMTRVEIELALQQATLEDE